MGKPQLDDNLSIPNMDRTAVVAYCHELGLDFVTGRTIDTATRTRRLARHLVVNRARWSKADVLAWLESTRDEEYLDRRNGAAS